MKIAIAMGVVVMVSAGVARADGDAPATHELVFDGNGNPHPENAQVNRLVEGDSLIITVDPTRLFPDRTTPTGKPGFAVGGAPPEVLGFYVAGPMGRLAIQKGTCELTEEATELATKTRDAAQKTLADPKASETDKNGAQVTLDHMQATLDGFVAPTTPSYPCVPSDDWKPLTGGRGYRCGAEPLTTMIDTSPAWSLVVIGDDKTKVACAGDATLVKGAPVSAVAVQVVNGTGEPEQIALAPQDGRWSTTYTLKANTRIVRLGITRLGEPASTRTIPIKVTPRDEHSRLRIQAELLATNRLRAISFAVALTPVSRKFFTDGPAGCVLGCRFTMSALLRLSGDDKTVVQLGGALGVNLVRAFQVNAGLLVGTADTNTAWRIERSWFVGIAIDPVILADALAAGSKRN
ncbi:MAG: hypothetical protein KIT31_33205 [Deltaproteobacteria bacterium]|nr:hypothetical protein [Deltaproteobacteria bacterium]